ncbi:hypothetical protein ACNQ21_00035 [Mycoplasma sp. VS299A]|uniref:hypothetical protein n=1 Tax=Mycoplasma sp. VS299A TaxID=3401690 RepID=UPI003AAF8D92
MNNKTKIKLQVPADIEVFETVNAIANTNALYTAIAFIVQIVILLPLCIPHYAIKDDTYGYVIMLFCITAFESIAFYFVRMVLGDNFKKGKYLDLNWKLDPTKFSIDALAYLYLTSDSWLLWRYISLFYSYKFGYRKYFFNIKYYIWKQEQKHDPNKGDVQS